MKSFTPGVLGGSVGRGSLAPRGAVARAVLQCAHGPRKDLALEKKKSTLAQMTLFSGGPKGRRRRRGVAFNVKQSD